LVVKPLIRQGFVVKYRGRRREEEGREGEGAAEWLCSEEN
jgi:hypothetical protein